MVCLMAEKSPVTWRSFTTHTRGVKD